VNPCITQIIVEDKAVLAAKAISLGVRLTDDLQEVQQRSDGFEE